jgi:beta-xylosidase
MRILSDTARVSAVIVLFATVAPTQAHSADVAPRADVTTPAPAPDFADPFVLADGETYFAFATGAAGEHVQVARSKDLRAWTPMRDALPVLPAWAEARDPLVWAPSVLRRPSGYVLYYTARDATSGFQCIGHAVSPRAEGPYVDDARHAFVCQTSAEPLCGSIDASPFVDDNGAAYLTWKSDENSTACRGAPRIWAQRLSPTGLELVGARASILSRDRPWEGALIEGPSMLKHDGRYLLFYSANDWQSASYAVGYATCSSPLGPCTKVTTDAPLFASHGDALGPGGQEFFSDGAQLWVAYHAWSAPNTTYGSGGVRSLRVSRVSFEDEKPVFGARVDLGFASR